MARVCVIGLGIVGKPTANHITSHHFVYGYDIDSAKLGGDSFFSTSNWGHIPEIDVFVVCVNTWWKEKPDMSAIKTVMQKIKEKSTRKTLVIIESTLSLGTARKLFDEIFNGDVLLAHCPHRYWEKDTENHGVVQIRVLGAVDNESLVKATEFYQSIKVSTHAVPTIEIAEMCKLAENSYRFVQIAFVEELKIICEENAVDFEKVRGACNSKWNVELLEARDGIGGSCLPKDIMILNYLASSAPLLTGAIKADNQYRRNQLRDN